MLALQALLRQHWRPGSMPCVSTGAGSVGLPRLHAPGGDARVWSESDSDAVVQLIDPTSHRRAASVSVADALAQAGRVPLAQALHRETLKREAEVESRRRVRYRVRRRLWLCAVSCGRILNFDGSRARVLCGVCARRTF